MVRTLFRRFNQHRSCINTAAFGTSFVSRWNKRSQMGELTYDDVQTHAKSAFLAGVSSVKPSELVKKNIHWDGTTLKVKGKEFKMKQPCHVIGFGKAVLEMALAVEETLGESMKACIVSVPVGTMQKYLVPAGSRIEVLEGAANNLPDKKAEENAMRILKVVQGLDCEETLLVLISGGGSALLPLPQPPVILEEKLQVIKLLANAGADISQLNCVRKRLSSVKGGRLAIAAQPAAVISLILSDVIGDPIDTIASGPTSIDPDLPGAAWDVICHFSLQTYVPQSVELCLTSKDDKPDKLLDNKIHNFVIGNNSVAIDAALQKMSSEGYSVCGISGTIQGNVGKVAQFYSLLGFQICEALSNDNINIKPLEEIDSNQTYFSGAQGSISSAINESCNKKGICLVAGGETTVTVTGRGVGGRNQELALRFAEEAEKLAKRYSLMEKFKVSLFSAGTDGIDGPTNAAGAFGYAEQLHNQDYRKYLKENDSHTFYSKLNGGKNLILTGHTGTNVMDIHILIIVRR